MGLYSLRIPLHQEPSEPVIELDQVGMNLIKVLSSIQQKQQRQ